jgi:hypothetical protein
MHDPTALPTPAVVRKPRPAKRRRERRMPLALMLLVGCVACVACVAFVAMIEAPLPEEIVLSSLERALGPAASQAR